MLFVQSVDKNSHSPHCRVLFLIQNQKKSNGMGAFAESQLFENLHSSAVIMSIYCTQIYKSIHFAHPSCSVRGAPGGELSTTATYSYKSTADKARPY